MDTPIAFESAVEKLEGIVKRLEADSTSLDESLRLFEEGIRLSRYCSTKLDEAEKKILTLVEVQGGDVSVEPLEEELD